MNGLKFGWIFLWAAFWLPSANAALFGDNDAHKRIDALTQRLTQLETVLSEQSIPTQQNTSRSLVDLSASIDQMRDEISQLRGQIEVLRYEINEIQKRQRDLYTDLDSRLRALEPGSSASVPPLGNPLRSAEASKPAAPPATPSSSSSSTSAESASVESRAYADAMAFFKKGDYSNATKAFDSFVTLYPNSAQASAAQYWAGNARFAQRDYRGAVVAQTRLLQNYPDSAKTPDAMLNLASAQMELGDKEAARTTLQSLISRYPNSDAATKARQRIH